MQPKRQAIVLDCTLRDGGYYNNWNFPRKTVAAYLNAMALAGVRAVEVGFRSLPTQEFMGAYYYSTDDFLRTLPIPQDIILCVMVNASELVGNSEEETRNIINKLFAPVQNSPVQMVRVAAHFSSVKQSVVITKELKNLGYSIGFNIMQAGGKSLTEMEQVAREVKSWDSVDVLYFADSFGNMQVDEVEGFTKVLSEIWEGPIGIHAHDNKNQALENTLKAFENGATWLDSTVLGMGRGAGNTKTEYLLLELKEKYSQDIHPESLFALVMGDFRELQERYKWGPGLLYYLSATYTIHPTYVQAMLADAKHDGSQIADALRNMKNAGIGPSFSKENLNRALYGGVIEPITLDTKSEFLRNRDVLILGAGPKGSEHIDAIARYIRKHRPYVISLNTGSLGVSEELVDAYAACHHSRLMLDHDKYSQLTKPLILPMSLLPPYFRKSIVETKVMDYHLQIQPHTFDWSTAGCRLPSSLALGYALGFGSSFGCKSIYLCGMDGYENDIKRHQEVDELLRLYKSNKESRTLISLTPTTYSVLEKRSIYSPEY